MQVLSMEKVRETPCQKDKEWIGAAEPVFLDEKKLLECEQIVLRDYLKYSSVVKCNAIVCIIEFLIQKELCEHDLIVLLGHVYQHSRHRRNEPLSLEEEKVYSWLLKRDVPALRPYSWFLGSRSPESAKLQFKQGKMSLRRLEKLGKVEVLKTLNQSQFRFFGKAKAEMKSLVWDVNKRFHIISVHRPVPHISLAGPFQTRDERRLVSDFKRLCDKYKPMDFIVDGYGT